MPQSDPPSSPRKVADRAPEPPRSDSKPAYETPAIEVVGDWTTKTMVEIS